MLSFSIAQFRSQANLIDWFNQTFERIFPEKENSDIGAIPYTHSIATQSPGECNINFYPFVNAHAGEEAQQIVSIIQSCYQKNPNIKIAILVRLRSHLQKIIPA
ncbi:3'-5' exonuclease [Coxiella endosymbiont of Amblyomma nuttalli]|uniref:3'-5' exonuclease n=1 Tax=Coxiella endosymbiont of Amblyomma nuttalli TaxID=2749996 RepID=UPI001FD2A3F8|nr:3'-5' exonuclease [Coxiella endosymbiont of Amblyomma nuttalli]